MAREFPNYGVFFPPTKRDSILQETKLIVGRAISDALPKTDDQSKASKRPKQCKNVDCALAAKTVRGLAYSEQTVTFDQPNDRNFSKARILIRGYNTGDLIGTDPDNALTLPWVEQAQVEESPFIFRLLSTLETIQIGVQSLNSDGLGADLTQIPIVAITLL